MKKTLDHLWPFIGLAAVAFSVWLLSAELKDVEGALVWRAIVERGPLALSLSVAGTVVAYGALAWYDRIAMLHIGRQISWYVISLVSFTSYALSHNIGASVVTSGLIRYRAYSRFGLSVADVTVVTAFCAFTFVYGSVFLGGLVLVGEPWIIERLFDLPSWIAFLLGLGMLAFVALYQIGALLHLKPLVIRSFRIEYPKPGVAFRQMFAAPIEILGAAAIIYFALPEQGNPGYFVVLGVFLASFSAALASHAPGGLGVFEVVFLTAMPEVPKESVLAALIVFRLLYLLIPLALGCLIVVLFERQALVDAFAALRARLSHPPAVPLSAAVPTQTDATVVVERGESAPPR